MPEGVADSALLCGWPPPQRRTRAVRLDKHGGGQGAAVEGAAIGDRRHQVVPRPVDAVIMLRMAGGAAAGGGT